MNRVCGDMGMGIVDGMVQLRKQQAVYLARKKQQQFGWSQEMMLGQTLFDDDDDDDGVEGS